MAVGSINMAGTLFGQAFGIRAHAGEIASTACVGFGLERLVLALVQPTRLRAAALATRDARGRLRLMAMLHDVVARALRVPVWLDHRRIEPGDAAPMG